MEVELFLEKKSEVFHLQMHQEKEVREKSYSCRDLWIINDLAWYFVSQLMFYIGVTESNNPNIFGNKYLLGVSKVGSCIFGPDNLVTGFLKIVVCMFVCLKCMWERIHYKYKVLLNKGHVSLALCFECQYVWKLRKKLKKAQNLNHTQKLVLGNKWKLVRVMKS